MRQETRNDQKKQRLDVRREQNFQMKGTIREERDGQEKGKRGRGEWWCQMREILIDQWKGTMVWRRSGNQG